MRHVRTVIWDWNGTLLNDAELGHQVLVDMCQARAIKIPAFEDYQKYYTHPVEQIYVRAGFDLERESVTALCDEWHEQYSGRIESVGLHDGALSLLEVLRREQIEQVVLSALPHNLLMRSVELNKVRSFFTHVQGLTDNLGRSKVENGHEMMHRVGAKKDETVIIGDSSHDLETATALGIECILVSRGFEHREKLERHGVRILPDFSDILAEFKCK